MQPRLMNTKELRDNLASMVSEIGQRALEFEGIADQWKSACEHGNSCRDKLKAEVEQAKLERDRARVERDRYRDDFESYAGMLDALDLVDGVPRDLIKLRAEVHGYRQERDSIRAELERVRKQIGSEHWNTVQEAAFAFADAWHHDAGERPIIEAADALTAAVLKLRAETEGEESAP